VRSEVRETSESNCDVNEQKIRPFISYAVNVITKLSTTKSITLEYRSFACPAPDIEEH
jgi:hypothetical protein